MLMWDDPALDAAVVRNISRERTSIERELPQIFVGATASLDNALSAKDLKGAGR